MFLVADIPSQFQKNFTINSNGYITASFFSRISIAIAFESCICFRFCMGIATSFLVVSIPDKRSKCVLRIKIAISKRTRLSNPLRIIAILPVSNIAKKWLYCPAMEL